MIRAVIAIVAVFLVWSVLDFLIHGVMLHGTYAATQELWRPENEMKMGLMSCVTFLTSVAFVGIYYLIASRHSLSNGLLYGSFYGFAAGISMGFGTYSVQAIPLSLAWSWMAGMFVKAAVAGAIVGLIVVPAASRPISPEQQANSGN